jgi:hypothetical protein
LFATNPNYVFGAVALKALVVYAIPTPWLHQDTTTVAPYRVYEDVSQAPEAHQPAYGHTRDGRADLRQVLLSPGVNSDGLSLRVGIRDGNTSDSTDIPVAIEECLALGLDGVHGIVADSKAYCKRTVGLCLEKRIRQELPRQWHRQSVVRRVEVDYSDERVTQEALRFLVVHSSQLAQQAAIAYAAAQAKEIACITEHVQRVEARWFACVADAEAAIAEYEGRGQGRRGRRPWPWRYHALHYRVEAVSQYQKRTQRGRPPQPEVPQEVVRYRLRVEADALTPSADIYGWLVFATTIAPEVYADMELLQAYHEQHTTVAPGFRWIKNPAAISPVWLEKPERIVALAMLTVVGLLVYAVIQWQVRSYLRDQNQQLPGNKGPTTTPTAAVVFAQFAPMTLVQFEVGSPAAKPPSPWMAGASSHGL